MVKQVFIDMSKQEEITLEDIKLMFQCEDGATIFGLKMAEQFRKIERLNSELFIIIDDMKELAEIVGKTEIYDEDKRMAYFGVIATDKGKKYIRDYCKQNNLILEVRDEDN